MLLNDVHLPLLIQSVLSEHKQYKTLVWKNLDQLSFLWAVFTKCKNNIKDGFRLENLSWRLWYRQSVLQKKRISNENIEFKTNPTSTTTLKRRHSLPNLSQYKENIHSQHIKIPRNKSKFYFNDEQLTFPKKNLLCSLSKPVSLLSDMIQSKTESLLSDMIQNKTESAGLRRCQSRYCRLDQFFLNAA